MPRSTAEKNVSRKGKARKGKTVLTKESVRGKLTLKKSVRADKVEETNLAVGEIREPEKFTGPTEIKIKGTIPIVRREAANYNTDYTKPDQTDTQRERERENLAGNYTDARTPIKCPYTHCREQEPCCTANFTLQSITQARRERELSEICERIEKNVPWFDTHNFPDQDRFIGSYADLESYPRVFEGCQIQTSHLRNQWTSLPHIESVSIIHRDVRSLPENPLRAQLEEDLLDEIGHRPENSRDTWEKICDKEITAAFTVASQNKSVPSDGSDGSIIIINQSSVKEIPHLNQGQGASYPGNPTPSSSPLSESDRDPPETADQKTQTSDRTNSLVSSLSPSSRGSPDPSPKRESVPVEIRREREGLTIARSPSQNSGELVVESTIDQLIDQALSARLPPRTNTNEGPSSNILRLFSSTSNSAIRRGSPRNDDLFLDDSIHLYQSVSPSPQGSEVEGEDEEQRDRIILQESPIRKRVRDRIPFRETYRGEEDEIRIPFRETYRGEEEENRNTFRKTYGGEEEENRIPFREIYTGEGDEIRVPFRETYRREKEENRAPFRETYRAEEGENRTLFGETYNGEEGDSSGEASVGEEGRGREITRENFNKAVLDRDIGETSRWKPLVREVQESPGRELVEKEDRETPDRISIGRETRESQRRELITEEARESLARILREKENRENDRRELLQNRRRESPNKVAIERENRDTLIKQVTVQGTRNSPIKGPIVEGTGKGPVQIQIVDETRKDPKGGLTVREDREDLIRRLLKGELEGSPAKRPIEIEIRESPRRILIDRDTRESPRRSPIKRPIEIEIQESPRRRLADKDLQESPKRISVGRDIREVSRESPKGRNIQEDPRENLKGRDIRESPRRTTVDKNTRDSLKRTSADRDPRVSSVRVIEAQTGPQRQEITRQKEVRRIIPQTAHLSNKSKESQIIMDERRDNHRDNRYDYSPNHIPPGFNDIPPIPRVTQPPAGPTADLHRSQREADNRTSDVRTEDDGQFSDVRNNSEEEGIDYELAMERYLYEKARRGEPIPEHLYDRSKRPDPSRDDPYDVHRQPGPLPKQPYDSRRYPGYSVDHHYDHGSDPSRAGPGDMRALNVSVQGDRNDGMWRVEQYVRNRDDLTEHMMDAMRQMVASQNRVQMPAHISFAGKDMQDVKQFIRDIEQYRKLAGMEGRDMALLVPTRLTHKAQAFYQDLEDHVKEDYVELMTCLERRFAEGAKPIAQIEFYRREMQPHEDPSVFLADLKRLASLGGISQNNILTWFVSKSVPRLGRYLQEQNLQVLEEAELAASRWWRIHKDELDPEMMYKQMQELIQAVSNKPAVSKPVKPQVNFVGLDDPYERNRRGDRPREHNMNDSQITNMLLAKLLDRESASSKILEGNLMDKVENKLGQVENKLKEVLAETKQTQEEKKNTEPNVEVRNDRMGPPKCYGCGGVGHLIRNCPSNTNRNNYQGNGQGNRFAGNYNMGFRPRFQGRYNPNMRGPGNQLAIEGPRRMGNDFRRDQRGGEYRCSWCQLNSHSIEECSWRKRGEPCPICRKCGRKGHHPEACRDERSVN